MDKIQLISNIEAVLEQARPYLQQDGGDVEFVDWEEDRGVLVVRLLGNCSDCPLSMMTLRAGIERLLMNKIPEIKRVEKVK